MSLEKAITENTQAVRELINALRNPSGSNLGAAPTEGSTKVEKTAAVATLEDVQAALISVAEKYDRKAALRVLGEFQAKKVGDLKPAQYEAVIMFARDEYPEAA